MKFTEAQDTEIKQQPFSINTSRHREMVNQFTDSLTADLAVLRLRQQRALQGGLVAFVGLILRQIPFIPVPDSYIMMGGASFATWHLAKGHSSYSNYGHTLQACVRILGWILEAEEPDFADPDVQRFLLAMVPLVDSVTLASISTKVASPHQSDKVGWFTKEHMSSMASATYNTFFGSQADGTHEPLTLEAFRDEIASKIQDASKFNFEYYLYGVGANIDASKLTQQAIDYTLDKARDPKALLAAGTSALAGFKAV